MDVTDSMLGALDLVPGIAEVGGVCWGPGVCGAGGEKLVTSPTIPKATAFERSISAKADQGVWVRETRRERGVVLTTGRICFQ